MEFTEEKNQDFIISQKFFEGLNEKIKGKKFYFNLNFFSIELELKENLYGIFEKKFKNKKEKVNFSPIILNANISSLKKENLSNREYNINFYEKGKNLIFSSPNFSAITNLEDLKKTKLAIFNLEEKIYADEIENFLRVYSALILKNFNSFLLHSSAVLIKDSALVFFGPSGAGKSTIAKIFKKEGFKTLSDDLNVLNYNNFVKIFSSPFLSEIKEVEKGIFPVKKIFYLKKDKKNFIEKIPKISQKAYLISCIPVLNFIKYYQEEIFNIVSNVTDKIEVEVLHFKKDMEVIRWLQLI